MSAEYFVRRNYVRRKFYPLRYSILFYNFTAKIFRLFPVILSDSEGDPC